MRKENLFKPVNNKYIYLNSASTTYTLDKVVESMNNYYNNYSVNINRGIDTLGYVVSKMYSSTRFNLSKYINSKESEIVFTRGTTDSINMIVRGIKHLLKEGDEIILTKAEHHSNLIPFLELQKEIGVKLVYVDYDKFEENLEKHISDKTKVITTFHVSNVLGIKRDLKYIGDISKKYNIISIIDGAQGFLTEKIDFKASNITFYAFSSHKVFGPKGLGFLIGQYEFLNKLKPSLYGGEMIDRIENGNPIYKELPNKLEGGTMMIPEVIGFNEVINYLNTDYDYSYVIELSNYLKDKLKGVKNIVIYNEDTESSIISFNIKGIHAHDLNSLLDKHKIIVRSGHHCASMLMEELGVSSTVRASLSIYNTKEDCDKLVDVLKRAEVEVYDELFS